MARRVKYSRAMRRLPSIRAAVQQAAPTVHRWLSHGRREFRRVSGRGRTLAAGLNYRYVAAGAALAGVVVVGGLAAVVAGAPGAGEIRTMGSMPVATVILDRHDKPAFSVFQEQRHEVALSEISPNLVNAILAIEDQRFYGHHGLDLWRIGGSMWANVREGELVQGASTITMQLARQSFLTLEKTWRRKLQEAWLAIRIEQMYSKEEILELYLNKVYFGAGYYGAEAAARGFFGKSASELDLDEAALIAGLVKAPSAYAPPEHLDRAVARRAVVLDQMVVAGMIDRDAARELSAKPVTLAKQDDAAGAWFKQAVSRELVDRFGWELVSQGGLRVYTTMDPAAQAAAEKSLVEGLDAIEKRTSFRHPTREEVLSKPVEGAPNYLQGALVAIDPATGAVRALVGGRDFADSQFDRVTQAHRQSGSAFKPFVYATALELGYSPATIVTGLNQPIATPEGPWLPNDGHLEADAVTVRVALRTSSNRAAAQMLQTIGIPAAVDHVKQLGLDAPPVPSLVLGSGDVTLMSLTAAYGVFASEGVLRAPYLIRRVEDATGKVLFETTKDEHRVISEESAYQMANMLADVVNRGTAAGVRQTGFRLPAAGKTGTTNEYRDAWFVGFTPELVAGVWVGFDQPKTIVPGGYASELAVPIWGTFMRDATAGSDGEWFNRPSKVIGVEICQESGLLPTSACSRVRRVSADGEARTVSTVAVEFFRAGTQPTEYCPLHDYSWFRGVQTASFDPDDFPASAVVGTLPAVARRPVGDQPGAPTPETVEAPERPEVEEATDERGGFWSRVFGGGGGGDDDSSTPSRPRRRGPRR